jgi:alkylated DNA repair protein (DNA oxidative demethylase)
MARRSPQIPSAAPEGLTYVPEFITEAEHHAIVSALEQLAFREVQMRGQIARRRVIHFGWDYDYSGWSIHPTTPPPPWLDDLARRCAESAHIQRESLEQFLVARYPAGATIGWHRDAPMFGTPVIGVSFCAPCAMKFRRRRDDDGFDLYSRLLEPRSLYILDGAARGSWQHSIPPIKGLRYSITMRTLSRRPSVAPRATA